MKHHSKKNKVFTALSSAAVVLPGISGNNANATSVEPGYSLGFRASTYTEEDIPTENLFSPDSYSGERYEIDVYQLRFRAAIGDTKEITLRAQDEDLSGASPWNILEDDEGNAKVVMSGASGGEEPSIEEARQDYGIGFRSVGDSSEWSVGLATSQENDYESVSGSLGYTHYFNDNNTSVNIGVSYSDDTIDATDADIFTRRPTDEEKNSKSLSIGFSQNLSKSSVIGMTYTYAQFDGFLSDAYKFVSVAGETEMDSRPDSRDQSSFTILWRNYFDSVNAALHTDYRYFENSWGLDSHTVSVDWYQNLPWGFQLVPGLRYYTQGKTEFFANTFDTAPANGYYSSDFRLSEFEALSYKLKLSKSFGKHAFHLGYETYEADGKGNEDEISPALLEFTHVSIGFDLNF